MQESLKAIASKVRSHMDGILTLKYGVDIDLLGAIRYSALSSGKMIRSYFAYQFCQILEVKEDSFLKLSAAIEFMHCYSLIHDDLPAMDDDDFRRGKKTCHKQYDEAIAILAGDALQSLAYETLSNLDERSELIVEIVKYMAVSVGYEGMVGGQYLDIYGKGTEEQDLLNVQKLKTGKLIEFSCNSVAILSGVSGDVVHQVNLYAEKIGIAFQIKDDLLDCEGDESVVGKALNKDKEQGKNNFVTILGKEKAYIKLGTLLKEAEDILNLIPNSEELKLFTRYLLSRDN